MNALKRKLRNFIKQIVQILGINKFLFFIKNRFASEKLSKTAEQARAELEQFSSCPQGTSIAENTLDTIEYDLQIVIPAYNVEKYIAECIDSILAQKTKYSYKVIVINDGSTDRTKEILEQYANHSKLQIIHQENKGFSGARNKGLDNINAKYVAFVDSDDKLAPNAIESLLDVAFHQDADIVEGGFYRLDDKLYLGYKHKKVKQVNAAIDLKGYPCGKVFKSALFKNIHFPENFWFEDSIGAFLIHPQAIKAFVIPDIVYIYRTNLASISYTAPFKKKSIDTYWVTELLLEERQKLNIIVSNDIFENFLRQVVLNYKRTQKMPIEIQKNIFICTKELLNKYFNKWSSKPFKHLIEAFQAADFGKYKLFCDLFIF